MKIHKFITALICLLQCTYISCTNLPCYGFESYCQLLTGYTILDFPRSGSFVVQNIDYTNRELRLLDADKCLARKMMFLNISSTPFQYKARYNNYYSLFKCLLPRDENIFDDDNNIHKIDCLSQKNYTIFSAPWNYSMPSCDKLGANAIVLPIDYEHDIEPSSLLLTWSGDSQCAPQLACPGDFGPPSSKNFIITVTIAIAFGVPSMLCAAWCVVKIIAMRRNSIVAATRIAATATNRQLTTQQSDLNTGTSGLDQPTLDSYPIVVIGESGRFLNSTNQEKTCSICLADYNTNDTLKILPECLHRFHADCIDQWLRAKALCPICRNMPPRTTL